MKYKYCQSCQKAYVRSRLEKDNCIYCNQPCETVEVKRNGIYYIGYGLTLGGAGLVLYPRLVENVEGPSFFFVTGIGVFIAGAILVMLGSVRMAQAAAAEVNRKK